VKIARSDVIASALVIRDDERVVDLIYRSPSSPFQNKKGRTHRSDMCGP